MSVINKMLRDLDHRANPSAAALPGPTALRQGTASVSIDTLPPAHSTGTASRLWMGLGLVAVAAASLGGWWWWAASPSADPFLSRSSSATAPPVAVAASAVPGMADAASASTATAPTPMANASSGNSNNDAPHEPSVASMILRMESSLSARKALDALLSASAPVVASNPPASNTRTASPPARVSAPAPTLAASSTVAAAPAPAPSERTNPRTAAPKSPTTAGAPNPTGDSTPILQRQQQAGGDALAQAQTLWSNGSREAAIDLMQQSIAAAERSAKANATGPTSTAVLLPLVREMARMQLAEARYGAVWEMLTRLEPLLGNAPDLWAIRANTAQRLGRHQDSVHAYMMALQSRPDEQRWLLGTAVSLAALGKTSSAAEMAEKARAVGPISKDILAYLRQTGVPIREQ